MQISTHTFHVPDRLIWNRETFGNLMDATDSPAHGLTFCQGKSQMAGDSLPEVIRHFGDKVFMVHVRDIATKAQGPTTPEIEQRLADLGYLEVPFGCGGSRYGRHHPRPQRDRLPGPDLPRALPVHRRRPRRGASLDSWLHPRLRPSGRPLRVHRPLPFLS